MFCFICGVQDFLKCLNLYAQEIISRNELINLANVSSSRPLHCLGGLFTG